MDNVDSYAFLIAFVFTIYDSIHNICPRKCNTDRAFHQQMARAKCRPVRYGIAPPRALRIHIAHRFSSFQRDCLHLSGLQGAGAQVRRVASYEGL